MELIYFDNPVVRSLMEIPQTWNDLHDPFIKTFGRRFRPIQSCYLFFEYIGFTKKKLKIPTELKKPIFDHHVELVKVDPDIPATISTEAIDLIDANLGSIANAIDTHIAGQMHTLQTTFEDLVTSREKRNALILGSITNIETSLQKTIAKRPGKLYQLDPKTHIFQEIFEPIFKIEL